jgi:hypothetical protein
MIPRAIILKTDPAAYRFIGHSIDSQSSETQQR